MNRPHVLHGFMEPDSYVRAELLWLLDYSRTYDVQFNECLAEARRRFQKGVRESSDSTPLPKK